MKKIVKGLIVCLGLFGLVALGSLTTVKAETSEEKSIVLDFSKGSSSGKATVDNAIAANDDLKDVLTYSAEKKSASNAPGFFSGNYRLYPNTAGDGGELKFSLNSDTTSFVSIIITHANDGSASYEVNGIAGGSSPSTTVLPSASKEIIIKNVSKASSGNQIKITGITLKYVVESTGNEDTATDVFEALETKTSLSFSYVQDASDFTFSNVKLRFGTTITKELYDDLLALDAAAEFGVVIIKESSLGMDPLSAETAGAKVQAIAPVQVAEANAAEADENGEFYQFAFVITQIPEAAYTEKFTAVVYVKIAGTYYYMAETTQSVCIVALEYANLELPALADHQDALEYLALMFIV